MGKLYVRIDDRLIHGQIIAAWSQTLGIERIIAVDNDIANNAIMKSIVTMGVPKNIESHILTIDEAKEKLPLGNKTTLLIVRQARTLALLKDDINNSDGINIGNCSRQVDEKYNLKGSGIGAIISLTESDYNTLEDLSQSGLDVYSQVVPTEKKNTWENLKKTIK